MEYILYGIAGGIVPDILKIIERRHEVTLPVYLKAFNFWFSLTLLMGLSALTVYLKKPDDVIEALAIGFAAPQIFSSLISSKLNGGGGQPQVRAAARVAPKNLFRFIKEWW